MAGGGLGGSSKGGMGGASNFDIGAIDAAVGQGIQALHNRYAQLGIGVPSGSAAQAAATGTNLTSAGPSTMEQMDTSNLQNLAQAAIGQVQSQNINNPAAPGSPANINANNQQLAQGLGGLASLAAA